MWRLRASYIARRLLGMAVVLSILLVATFFMVRLFHADPARQIAGENADPQTVSVLDHELGLDRPVLTQFVDYIQGLARLDLGVSYSSGVSQPAPGKFYGLPVSQIIGQTFPWTLLLAGVAIVLVAVFSLPIGMLAALLTRDGRNRPFEVVFTGSASFVHSTPVFLQGTLLSAVFAVWLRWLPVGTGPFIPVWQAIILPAVAVAIGDIVLLARIIRVETLNALAQDYVRTARSKRLPTLTLYRRHILPNVLTATLTLGGLTFANLLAGTVIVENVFDWPGIGSRLVGAILIGDYPVIQAAVLLLGAGVIVINTGVDLAIGFLDPRTLNR
jgi:peptide/nickel transport system permease protein